MNAHPPATRSSRTTDRDPGKVSASHNTGTGTRSTRPQAHSDGRCSLDLHDGRLRITGASIGDGDILRSATSAQHRGQDLEQWLISTLRLGAVANEAASSGADLHKMQTAIDGLASRIDAVVTASTSSLSDAVTRAVDADSGPLALASQRAVDRLASGIGRLIHENGDLPRSVRSAVTQCTDQALNEFHRAVAQHSETMKLAVGQDRNAVKDAVLAALQSQHAELTRTVSELQNSLAQQQAVAAAVASTTRRNSADGFALERDCGAVLSRIAAHAGDGGSAPVGALRGDADTKKGDHLVNFLSLHPTEAPRMVVEIKNRMARPLSIQEWRQELDAARDNRSAVVAMGITPAEYMPVPGEPLVVLDASTLLVAWSPREDDAGEAVLTAAYLLLRMTAARSLNASGDLDKELVRSRIEELQSALSPLAQLDRSIAAGRRSLEDIETVARKVRNDTTTRLQRMHEELTA